MTQQELDEWRVLIELQGGEPIKPELYLPLLQGC